MHAKLSEFVERIQALQWPMSSMSAALFGSTQTGSEILQLKKEAAQLMQLPDVELAGGLHQFAAVLQTVRLRNLISQSELDKYLDDIETLEGRILQEQEK